MTDIGNNLNVNGKIKATRQAVSQGDVPVLESNGRLPEQVMTAGILKGNISADATDSTIDITYQCVGEDDEIVTLSGASTSRAGLMTATDKTKLDNLGAFQSFSIVESLPSTDISTNTIYLVLKGSGASGNLYDEYIYVNGAWEHIGDTALQINIDQTPTQISIGGTTLQIASDTQVGLMSASDKSTLDLLKNSKPVAGTGLELASDGKTINHENTITARTSNLGSSTQIPIIRYDSEGHITYGSTVTVYPPTTAGRSGQVWTSDGSGQGKWADIETGVDIDVDSALSTTSTNPVQNKVITNALEDKQDSIVAGTGLDIASDGKTINHENTVTARTSNLGSATSIPILRYDAQGHITYGSSVNVYPPTTIGNSGEVWVSDGSGTGAWKKLVTISTSNPSGGSNGDLWFKYE